MMWKYIRKYLHFAVPAAAFMVGEVMMDLVQPGLMSRIIDEGVLGLHHQGTGDIRLIFTLGLAMIGLVVFGGTCGVCNNIFVHLTGQNIGNEMRKDCFRRIMAFSFPQMDQFTTGSMITRVTNDITQVQNFVAQFVRGMIRTSMLMAGSIYFMFRLNRQFGMIVLCAFPFLLGCMGICLYLAAPLLSKLQAQLDRLNGILQEDVSGIRIIKACVREEYEKQRFGKCNEALTGMQRLVLVIFAFMNPAVNGLMYLVVTVILYAGSFQVKEGMATPGADHMVLKHINLTVRPGETLAIMGATGCGKTTLAALISRFYDVTEGAVLVDDVDVRRYRLKVLRDKVAAALQKSELFSTGIRENIAWGDPSAPEEKILEAAEIAQADGFIRGTPNGYETMVAERGMSLSGGQKQRISIARAVLKQAEILIFDDSTSALDLKTEAYFYTALGQARPECTKLLIAQRIASVRRADRIAVLNNGTLEAVGTHEELLKTCRTYQDIYDSQIGKEGEKNG